MRETICQFGSESGLVGIFTQPDNPMESSTPVVVLVSAGLLHRVGPFGLYISLARKLAEAGVSSLRFDLSSVGDSESSKLAVSIEERTLADISSAYDFLQEKFGSDKFVVGGLCSGADDAFRATLDDQRVVGSFQLDGMGYRTKRFYKGLVLDHYLPRLASREKWSTLIKGFDNVETSASQAVSGNGEEDQNRSMPTIEQASAGLAEMEERGQKSLLVYTGGVSDYYNYSGQIFDSIPAAKNYKNVSECYLPDSDHTYMLKRDKDKVLSVICDWYNTCWPIAA